MSSPNSSFAAYLASMDVWSSALPPLVPLAPSSTSSMTGITLSSADSLLASSPNKRPRSDSPNTSEEDHHELHHHQQQHSEESEVGGGKYFHCSSPTSFESISILETPSTLLSLLPTDQISPLYSPSTIGTRHFSHLTFSNLTSLTPLPTTTARPGVSGSTSPTGALRSILHSMPSPASSSPPISRPLSRRSSAGASSKSVRFARCTNASVFPAFSGEEYDRSPIVPTCESESLALPRRKRSEAEGWIKCVERERAAAAKAKANKGGAGLGGKKIDGGLGIKGATACMPCEPGSAAIENPVEGVHGLIEGSNGGYFVGEERSERSRGHEEEDEDDDEDDDEDVDVETDDMIVDDDGDDEGMSLSTSSLMIIPPIPNSTCWSGTYSSTASTGTSSSLSSLLDHASTSLSLPALVHMDDSSGDDSDGLHPLPSLLPLVSPFLDPLVLAGGRTKDRAGSTTPPIFVSVVEVSTALSSHTSSNLGFGFMDRSVSLSVEEEEEKRRSEEMVEEEEVEAEEERNRKGKKNGRYGICALGKYSRAEVFQSYDSLGGF